MSAMNTLYQLQNFSTQVCEVYFQQNLSVLPRYNSINKIGVISEFAVVSHHTPNFGVKMFFGLLLSYDSHEDLLSHMCASSPLCPYHRECRDQCASTAAGLCRREDEVHSHL